MAGDPPLVLIRRPRAHLLLAAALGVGLLLGCRIPCDGPDVDQRQCAEANATIAAAEREVSTAVDRAARQATDAAVSSAKDEVSRQTATWWDGVVARFRGMPGGTREPRPPAPTTPIVSAPAAVPVAASVVNVPFVPQIWPGNTVLPGKDRPGTTGLNNCGPASVAMAIQKFRGKDAVTLDQVAHAMRGKPNSNVQGANSKTDFQDDKTVKYLASTHRLALRRVGNLAALRAEIAADHPVIVLVDNSKYVRPENGQRVPYPEDGDWLQDHIVVVVGYDAENVYIHDPLAWPSRIGERFRVPIAAFQSAADAKRDPDGAWHASAALLEAEAKR